MGCAEGPLGDESTAGGQESAHAPHHGHLDRLVQREGRQDACEATGEHGLPRARRPEHDHVVRPCGGDLERALGMGVTPDVGEVDGVGRRGGQPSADIRRGGWRLALPVQEVDRVLEGRDRDDAKLADRGGLRCIVRGHHEGSETAAPAGQGDGEYAANRAYSAVE